MTNAVPVQRIPRYKLLLAELLKHTDEGHHDFANITDALEKVTAVANDVNEAIRRQEEMSKLLELQELFGSCTFEQIYKHTHAHKHTFALGLRCRRILY